MNPSALIASLLFPLHHPGFLRDGSHCPWQLEHAAYIREQSALLCNEILDADAIKYAQRFAWGNHLAKEPPTAMETIQRMAGLLLECRPLCGSLRLTFKSSPTGRAKTGSDFPYNPSEIWTTVTRMIDPDLLGISFLVQHYREAFDDDELARACYRRIDSTGKEWLRILPEGFGDYHVHQGAARRFGELMRPGTINCPEILNSILQALTQKSLSPQEDWEKKGKRPLDPIKLSLVDGRMINSQLLHGLYRVVSHLVFCYIQALNRRHNKNIDQTAWPTALRSPAEANDLWSRLFDICVPEADSDTSNQASESDWFCDRVLARQSMGSAHEFDDPRLLRDALQAVDRSPPDGDENKKESFKLLLDRMLRLRNLIYRTLVYQLGKPGLRFFRHSYIQIEPFEEGWRSKAGLSDQVQAVTANGRVNRLELRFTLNEKGIENQLIDLLEEYLQWQKANQWKGAALCFTAALVKDDEPLPLPDKKDPFEQKACHKIRHFSLINKYLKQVTEFSNFVARHPDILYLVRGLDVCNLEKAVPNWVPALMYRLLPELVDTYRKDHEGGQGKDIPSLPRWRHTFHAGEDFDWPVQGLRAIHECVGDSQQSGFLSRGDRIGHGIALGLDIDTWLSRHNDPMVPLGTLLDDLIWAWGLIHNKRIEWVTDDEENEVAKDIRRVLNELAYRANKPLQICKAKDQIALLWEAYLMRFDSGTLRNNAGGPPIQTIESFCQGVLKNYNNNKAGGIYHEYLTSPELRKAEQSSLVFPISSNNWRNRMQVLQDHVRKQVAKSGIGIEVCPTSNLLVADIGDARKHPIFRLVPLNERPVSLDESKTTDLKVCLSSDDPLTFNTDIVREYQFIHDVALRLEADEAKVVGWLQRIDRMGKKLSFYNDLNAKQDEQLCLLSEKIGRIRPNFRQPDLDDFAMTPASGKSGKALKYHGG